ncbi:hypothetical protein [Streptomyces sp. NPDC091649]|uniref:hypothetical protein n=1 Tax=Streptomyces sp. NPDC091649 TaxID=3366004 RepID=UPI00382E742F
MSTLMRNWLDDQMGNQIRNRPALGPGRRRPRRHRYRVYVNGMTYTDGRQAQPGASGR